MITKVQKWGNSQGLRISKELLADADLAVGDAVEVAAREGTIVITPARRVRGGHDLRQLVKDIPADYRAEEFDWGPPAGHEVW
jgi:antitoxin MazE